MAVHTVQTEPLKEILNELFSLLETLETNNAAILQFLRDEGIATDEKLSPYFEQAGRASNVKWLAARRRMEYLLTPIQKEESDGDKGKGQVRKDQVQDAKSAGNGQNEKHDEQDKAEQAQALAGKPVESSPESKSATEKQEHEKETAPNDHSASAKAAKATSASRTQGPEKSQERKAK